MHRTETSERRKNEAHEGALCTLYIYIQIPRPLCLRPISCLYYVFTISIFQYLYFWLSPAAAPDPCSLILNNNTPLLVVDATVTFINHVKAHSCSYYGAHVGWENRNQFVCNIQRRKKIYVAVCRLVVRVVGMANQREHSGDWIKKNGSEQSLDDLFHSVSNLCMLWPASTSYFECNSSFIVRSSGCNVYVDDTHKSSRVSTTTKMQRSSEFFFHIIRKSNNHPNADK